jgi:hypothetical protein
MAMQPQELTSPPTWAQMLLQQMAQTQAMQNKEQERRTLHDSAQEERIRRLEAMLEQQVLLTMTTMTMTTNKGPATKPMLEPQRVENIPCPKARLPDLVLFSGNTSDWLTWRVTMENKLSVDGEAISTPQDQFMYMFSRLEKLAWKNLGTFVKLHQNTSNL